MMYFAVNGGYSISTVLAIRAVFSDADIKML